VSGPFARILLATEHTDFDVGAERVAFAMAKACGLRLAAVVPMVTNDELEATAPALVAQAEEAVHARLIALRAAAASADVVVEARVRRGDDPSHEIVDEAREIGADLVIARRRGKQSFLARMMVGEMVGKVAILAPCSVLLVPRACGLWSQRVLAGVDDSGAAARVAATAAAVATHYRVPLTVASAAVHDHASERTAADTAVAAAMAVAKREGADCEGRTLTGRAADAIVAAAGESGADLIVVGRDGEPGHRVGRVLGGTAHRTIGLAACPVLVVKP
jgi:nucleotide-binding universal stress UspA family protein